ncbi:MAG TPA: ferritin-like domain-containing protein [Phycisphaerales bacterium]|nr:ferritin-like domain-containing protein [Phycisphaerales bacterium]
MLDTLKSLLEDQIKDLYNAENQLVKALPKMAKKASSEELRAAFEAHLEETRGHVDRLTEVAQLLEIKPGGKVCKAMQGLVDEGKEVLEEDGEGAVIDAALIAAAQRVEHYEIAAYGSARAMAEQLGEEKIIKLLQATLDEEKAADTKLTGISENEVLPATELGDEEGDETETPARDRRAKR